MCVSPTSIILPCYSVHMEPENVWKLVETTGQFFGFHVVSIKGGAPFWCPLVENGRTPWNGRGGCEGRLFRAASTAHLDGFWCRAREFGGCVGRSEAVGAYQTPQNQMSKQQSFLCAVIRFHTLSETVRRAESARG